MTKKLYKVVCHGMQGTYGTSYVVDSDPTSAYLQVKEFLDRKTIGTIESRKLHSITLVAECTEYPSCGTILYLGETDG